MWNLYVSRAVYQKGGGWSQGDVALNPLSTTKCLWASHIMPVRVNFLICKVELIHRGLLSVKLCGGFKTPGIVPHLFEVLESTQIARRERKGRFG